MGVVNDDDHHCRQVEMSAPANVASSRKNIAAGPIPPVAREET
jgi:hypothetical protein